MQSAFRSKKQFVQRGVVVLPDLFRISDVEPERIDKGGIVTLYEIGW